MASPADLADDLSRLVKAADAFLHAVQAGEDISLEGLNDEVRRLCAVVEAYPERADEHVKEVFVLLRNKLDLLAYHLTQHREALKSEADKLAQRRQAISAYESQNLVPPSRR